MDIVNTGTTPIGIVITPTQASGAISSFDLGRETPKSISAVVSPAGTNNRARLVHYLPCTYSYALSTSSTALASLVYARTAVTSNPSTSVFWAITV